MKKGVPAATGLVLAGMIFLYILISRGSGEMPVSRGSPGMPVHGTADVPDLSDCPVRTTEVEGIVPGGTISAEVERIVDGDTLVAGYRSKEYRVRLLCMDTPESVKKNTEEQAYSKEAAERLKELVEGRQVKLVFEKGVRDDYGRLLAYVVQDDGTCVNALMVAEGLARVEAVEPNTGYEDYFTGLMEDAVQEGRGLWSLPEDERPFVKNKNGYYYPRYYDEEAA